MKLIIILLSIILNSCATTPESLNKYDVGDCLWYKVKFSDGGYGGPILRIYEAGNYNYTLCSDYTYLLSLPSYIYEYRLLETDRKSTDEESSIEVLSSDSSKCKYICNILFRE